MIGHEQSRVLLSLIIVNYNQWDLTAACIEAVRARIDIEPEHYEMIVVDNASADRETGRFRSAAGHDVRVLRNTCNLGFGQACNLGAHASLGATFWFLNNDATLESGSVSAVLRALERDSTLGGISAALRYPSGESQTAGQAFPGLLTPLASRLAIGAAMREHPTIRLASRLVAAMPFAPRAVRAYFRNFTPRPGSSELTQYDWITAASLFMRRGVFDSVGGFDPEIFLYNEDLDLCWRLSRKGYRFAVFSGLNVVHAVGVSSKRNRRIERIRRRTEDIVYRRILPAWSYWLYSWLIRPL